MTALICCLISFWHVFFVASERALVPKCTPNASKRVPKWRKHRCFGMCFSGKGRPLISLRLCSQNRVFSFRTSVPKLLQNTSKECSKILQNRPPSSYRDSLRKTGIIGKSQNMRRGEKLILKPREGVGMIRVDFWGYPDIKTKL